MINELRLFYEIGYTLSMFIIFFSLTLLFGLFFKLGARYWSYALSALFMQWITHLLFSYNFSGFQGLLSRFLVDTPWLSSTLIPLILFGWVGPIYLLYKGYCVAKKTSLPKELLSLLCFCLLIIALCLTWIHAISQNLEFVRGKVTEVNLETWDRIISEEGEFKALFPLPPSKRVYTKEIKRHSISAYTYEVDDKSEDLRYIITATSYPRGYHPPPINKQMTLTLKYLIKSFGTESYESATPIDFKGNPALEFLLNGEEFMVRGLIVPTEHILYQLLFIYPIDQDAKETYLKFTSKFEPLYTEISN